VRRPNLLQDAAIVEVTDGPDIEEFGTSAGVLWRSNYTVEARSNHIGLRLAGARPERLTTTEIISRGVPVGAVEAPPGDELLVLHRGRGVTAGYPVLAVVTWSGLNRLAQVRPGDRVVFRRVGLDHALETARLERDHLADLRKRVATIFRALGVDRPGHDHRGAA
jgi:5-oxoprolinase (ATP-hydrolysing) subunit C